MGESADDLIRRRGDGRVVYVARRCKVINVLPFGCSRHKKRNISDQIYAIPVLCVLRSHKTERWKDATTEVEVNEPTLPRATAIQNNPASLLPAPWSLLLAGCLSLPLSVPFLLPPFPPLFLPFSRTVPPFPQELLHPSAPLSLERGPVCCLTVTSSSLRSCDAPAHLSSPHLSSLLPAYLPARPSHLQRRQLRRRRKQRQRRETLLRLLRRASSPL